MFEALLTHQGYNLFYVNSYCVLYLYSYLNSLGNIDVEFLEFLLFICNLEFEGDYRVYFRYVLGYYEFIYVEFDNNSDTIELVVKGLESDMNSKLLYSIKDSSITGGMQGVFPGVIIYKDELWKR